MLLPIRTVTRPAALAGQSNGRLDDALLVSIPGLSGGPTVRLVEPAATAWRALTAAASAAGHTLKATSAVDSYRPYAVQERTFLARYTTVPIAGASTRTWQGKTWYLKPGNAPAAAPGTSNHGWGLAVDTGEERDSDAQAEPLDAVTLGWLVDHELAFGFSHEIQEENWHIRYYTGDQIPAAVQAFMEGDEMTPQQWQWLQSLNWRVHKGVINLEDPIVYTLEGETKPRSEPNIFAQVVKALGVTDEQLAQIRAAAFAGAQAGDDGASADEVKAIIDAAVAPLPQATAQATVDEIAS